VGWTEEVRCVLGWSVVVAWGGSWTGSFQEWDGDDLERCCSELHAGWWDCGCEGEELYRKLDGRTVL
jgi:hypothetical protein